MFLFLDQYSVPMRKVFWVGMVVALFNPPVVGLVFSLLFAFKKETRRLAFVVALWAIVWTILSAIMVSALIYYGDVHIDYRIL